MDSEKRGSFNEVRDIEAAKKYDDVRFDTSPRMRRLDAWERNFAGLVLKFANDAGGEILDMPCGNGRFFPILSQASKSLRLIDLAPTMLEALVEKHPEAAKCERKQGDIMNIPLEDGSVDLTFTMRLFHHMNSPEQRKGALAELSRVSRRYVAISFYDTRTWRYWRKRLRNKTPSGYAVNIQTICHEAADADLRLVLKHPTISFNEQQRCLLFEKTSS